VASKGRILGLDYGEKNIGLACTDELGLTVQPLPSILNPGKRNFLKVLHAKIRKLGVRKIVLGIPIRMDGTRGDAAVRMEGIQNMLESGLKIPVVGIEETLSTVEAMEFWKAMNPKQQKKYRTVDSLAAAFILERYLKEN
jgi:putative Holliday junction resolvase